ncbi:MAG: hypothetical protein ACOYXB_01335 [Bacteroidota bacterium]
MKTSIQSGLFLFLLLSFVQTGAQTVSFKGQAIGWTTVNPAAPFQAQGGIRYIPELSFSHPAGKGLKIEGELSANLWGSLLYSAGDSLATDYRVAPYRVWIKLSGDQFELRAGLQKISFGSSMMLRPLMWFDRMDPRDPLQLTDGVYGLLGRYYFNNNANIWLWGLYGNKKTKGWEFFETLENNFEFGGRAQVPLWKGELALSYHHRVTDPTATFIMANGMPTPENRLAMDGKFNFGAGLWFETSVSRYNFQGRYENTGMLNIGSDYTFNLGEGLHATAEFFRMAGYTPYDNDTKLNFGGLSLHYPINIIHSISLIAFYDFTNNSLYRFVNWSMAYDRWSFYLMGFWNPENYALYNFSNNTNLFGGWGFQLMAVFNH